MKYFKSKDVKVFPCSYRGYYDIKDGENTIVDGRVFDPEARIPSEYNLISLASKDGVHNSFVISNENNLLKLVLGGYYFEIDLTDSEYNNEDLRYFGIATQDTTLQQGDEEIESTRKTKILVSLTANPSLDVKIDDAYYFQGLGYTKDKEDFIEFTNQLQQLQVFDEEGKIAGTAKLPKIYHGEGNAESIVFFNSIDNIASGKNSFAAGEHVEASGNNSAAFGSNTIASRDNSVVIGKYNTDMIDTSLFAIGNGSEDAKHTIFEVTNNEILINKASLSSTGKSKISTDSDVDLSASDKTTTINGNLTVKQISKLNGDVVVDNDKLVIKSETGELSTQGTMTVKGLANLAGGIKVDTDKFTVDKDNGDTVVAGTLEVTGQADFINGLKVNHNDNTFSVSQAGNIKIGGTADIFKDVTIHGGELKIVDANDKDNTYVKLAGNGDLYLAGKVNVDGADGLTVANGIEGKSLVLRDQTATQVQFGQTPLILKGNATGTTINKKDKPNNIQHTFNFDISGNAKLGNFTSTTTTPYLSGQNPIKDSSIDGNLTVTENFTLTKNSNTVLGPVNNVSFAGGNSFKKTLLDLCYPIGTIYT